MNAQERKEELIKRLELRRRQLLTQTFEPSKLKYPIHSGHHLRDIMTILAYLSNKNQNTTDALIRTLPTEEDV